MRQNASQAKPSTKHRELEMLRYVASMNRHDVNLHQRKSIERARKSMLFVLSLVVFLAICGFLHEFFA